MKKYHKIKCANHRTRKASCAAQIDIITIGIAHLVARGVALAHRAASGTSSKNAKTHARRRYYAYAAAKIMRSIKLRARNRTARVAARIARRIAYAHRRGGLEPRGHLRACGASLKYRLRARHERRRERRSNKRSASQARENASGRHRHLGDK